MKQVKKPRPSKIFASAVVESRRALRHEVVRLVLLEIFRGNLAPGSRLIAQTLSRQMGVSATPLREALVELEAIGMVEISHHRGAVVAAFGPAELRGIYQVRRVLEVEAVRCACGRIDRETLQGFLAAMREYAARPVKSAVWLRAVMASDARLHATIAAAGDSPRLAKEIDRYALLLQTISEAIGNQHRSKEDGIREHVAIIQALLEQDPDGAALAMTRHIEATAARALSVMFAVPGGRGS
jgi:DNA-binding GntR family transcriptional regulator